MQLVADANVLLSAVIGGRARLILQHPEVEAVFTPAAAMDEVYEYLPSLARKKRLHLDTLLLTLAALPVTVVDRAEYRRQLPRVDLLTPAEERAEQCDLLVRRGELMDETWTLIH